MTGLYPTRLLKAGLALTLAFSLSACGAVQNPGKPVESTASSEKHDSGSQTGGAAEGGTEEVTQGQHGDAGNLLVSKKVELPVQPQYPKDEDYIKDNGEYDVDAYSAANDAW